MQRWIFGILGLLAGTGLGWFLRGKKEARKVLNQAVQPEAVPDSGYTDMSLTDWAEVDEEHFADAEHPEDDPPDEIVIPQLPFEVGDEEDEEEEDNSPPFNPFYDAPRIETITEEQYLAAYNAYGKDTLYYFHDVDELTFSDEDRIDDKDGTAGPVYDMFFDERGMKLTDVVYVRNNRVGIDFMIELKNGVPSWYESE